MNPKTICAALALLASANAAHASAVGTLIPAASATDMVYDYRNHLVYVANGAQVLRYNVDTGKFLTPINVGGNLEGIDLSPDGKTLAIGDSTFTTSNFWLHFVDTTTFLDNKQTFPDISGGEEGTFAVAYGFNGDLIATENVNGLDFADKYTAATRKWSRVLGFGPSGMVSASGDGKWIAYSQPNDDSGNWGRYEVATSKVVLGAAIGEPVYEISTNSDGSQATIPSVFGAWVFDTSKTEHVKILGKGYTSQPNGGAYDPVRPVAYFPWVGSSIVRVYDMTTFTLTQGLDFGDVFGPTGNHSLGQGRTRISPDGSLLMVKVTGGVRILRLYAPLAAPNITASTTAGKSVQVPMKATIGVPGTITYAVLAQPAHGTASVSGNTLTYAPAAGFSGSDVVQYHAYYGRSGVVAKVTVTVAP